MRLTDSQEAVRVFGLALISAERTHETRRFQSSSAPGVLLSPQGEQRELEQRRTVVRNYAERLRAGSSPARFVISRSRVQVPPPAPVFIGSYLAIPLSSPLVPPAVHPAQLDLLSRHAV